MKRLLKSININHSVICHIRTLTFVDGQNRLLLSCAIKGTVGGKRV